MCYSVCASVGHERVCGQVCAWTSVLAVVDVCVPVCAFSQLVPADAVTSVQVQSSGWLLLSSWST